MQRQTAPSRAARAVRRPVLRPGVHVLRRDAATLQVGLDPARALVLPDDEPVRRLLSRLASPAAVDEGQPYDDDLVRLLDEAGLVCDCDTLLPLVPNLPRQPGAGASRADVAAAAARCGDAVPSLLEARAAPCVVVAPTGAPEAAAVAATLTGLLAGAGTRPRIADPGTTTARGREDAPGLGVLVSVGEPAREELDAWLRAGTPHLVLRLVEGHVTVGPFVQPGESACLRCVDAHHTDVDPAWPLLVTQHARAAARPREDSVPEPVDSALATLGAAWAAREVVTAAEGGRPATTGVTIRLDPLLTALETQHWPLHPDCGCSWS